MYAYDRRLLSAQVLRRVMALPQRLACLYDFLLTTTSI
jgi:hypothetical protein